MSKRIWTIAIVGVVVAAFAPVTLASAAGIDAGDSAQRAGLEIEPNGFTQRAGLEIEPNGFTQRGGLDIEPNG